MMYAFPDKRSYTSKKSVFIYKTEMIYYDCDKRKSYLLTFPSNDTENEDSDLYYPCSRITQSVKRRHLDAILVIYYIFTLETVTVKKVQSKFKRYLKKKP